MDKNRKECDNRWSNQVKLKGNYQTAPKWELNDHCPRQKIFQWGFNKYQMKRRIIWVLTLACTPNYLGGWNWKDQGLRLPRANSSQDSISKIIRTNWIRDAWHKRLECLLYKCEALSLPVPHTQKKKKKKERKRKGINQENKNGMKI
jgi:hypothetical protein